VRITAAALDDRHGRLRHSSIPLALDVAPNAIIPMDELPPQKRPV